MSRSFIVLFVALFALMSCSDGKPKKNDTDQPVQDETTLSDEDILQIDEQSDTVDEETDPASDQDSVPGDVDTALDKDISVGDDDDTATIDEDLVVTDEDSPAADAVDTAPVDDDTVFLPDEDTIVAADEDAAVTDTGDTTVVDEDIAVIDGDTADEDTAVTDDDTVDEDSTLPDTDIYVPSCPNGVQDDGEFCDSSTLACTDVLGPHYSGMAPCADNCLGYDTAGCTADTQTYYCPDKPATGTLWNKVASYIQTWDGSQWLPADDTVTEYNTEESFSECRYKCAANYEWDGGKCAAVTRWFDCSAKPETGTVWNSVPNYIQTWNGTNWTPPDDNTTEYNTVSDDASCRFKCDSTHVWDGSECLVSIESRQWGTGGGDAGYAVATDASGNVFVAGYTLGDLDGNTGYGNADLFVTKWDTDLAKVWTRQLGSSGLDTGKGVAVDGDGNVFAAGGAGDAFDGGTALGGGDAILVKWNTDGDKAWSKEWGTIGYDIAQGVTTDGDGNIYVVGYTENTFADNTSAGGYDAFVTKWNANGTLAWTRQWGTAADDFGKALAIDADGDIFVTGYTGGAFEDCTNAGGNDIFLTKWGSDGTIAWTVQWGTAAGDIGNAVALDGDGNIAVAGWTGGALDDNTSVGGEDIFVTKWEAAGTKAWTRQIGRTDDDRGEAVFTDGDGNIYVSGFAISPFGDDAIYYGWEDVFLTKWDTDGARIWTKAWGTYSFDYGYAAAMDNAGHVVMTGQTYGNFSTLGENDNYDAFLLRYTLPAE